MALGAARVGDASPLPRALLLGEKGAEGEFDRLALPLSDGEPDALPDSLAVCVPAPPVGVPSGVFEPQNAETEGGAETEAGALTDTLPVPAPVPEGESAAEMVAPPLPDGPLLPLAESVALVLALPGKEGVLSALAPGMEAAVLRVGVALWLCETVGCPLAEGGGLAAWEAVAQAL